MKKNEKYDPTWDTSERWDSFYAEWSKNPVQHWNNREICYLRMLKHIPSTTNSVIDLGCGLGTGFKVLEHRKYPSVWGCDDSELAVKFCQSKFLECETIQKDINKLDETGLRWNVGLLVQTLEHLSNPGETIRSLLRNLDVLLISVPHMSSDISAINEHQWLFEVSDFEKSGADILEKGSTIIAKFTNNIHNKFNYLCPKNI